MRRLLPLLLVLSLAGCAQAQPAPAGSDAPPTTVNTATLVHYASDELGFEISYPSGWSVATDVETGIVTFSAPPDESGLTTNFNVTVGDVPSDLPPAVYYQGEVSRLESQLEDVTVVEAADVEVDGVAGRGITLFSRQGGLDVGISRLIVLKDGRAYEASFFAPAARLDELSPLVSELFGSFGFLG